MNRGKFQVDCSGHYGVDGPSYTKSDILASYKPMG